jgi:uncharacterized protein DUF4375
MARNAQQQADFDLLSPFVERVSERIDEGRIDELSDLERHVHAIWSLEGEVNNGGFEQYFSNSAADFVEDAVAGLEAIGARCAAQIVVRATRLFPGEVVPGDAEERQSLLDSLPEEERRRLDALDEEFFKYPDDLEHLMAEYVRGSGRWPPST